MPEIPEIEKRRAAVKAMLKNGWAPAMSLARFKNSQTHVLHEEIGKIEKMLSQSKNPTSHG